MVYVLTTNCAILVSIVWILIFSFVILEMEDTEALPNYPYRDDALLIFEVIHDYVREVLEAFYGTLRTWVLNFFAVRTENENWCHTRAVNKAPASEPSLAGHFHLLLP